MNIKKYAALALAGLMVLGTLTGCAGIGKRDVDGAANAGDLAGLDGTKVDYDEIYRNSEAVNVLETKWMSEDDITSPDYYMSVSTYESGVYENHEDWEGYYQNSVNSGSKVYTMTAYYTESETDPDKYEAIYYLEIFDAEVMEMSTIKYRCGYYLDGLAVSNGRVIAYTSERDEEGYVTSCNLVELMEDGTVNILADIYSVIEQAGLLPDAYWAIEMNIAFNAYEEEAYILSNEYSSVGQQAFFRVDLKGSDSARIDGVGGTDETIVFLCNTYDGIPLFISYDAVSDKSEILWIKNGNSEVLYECSSRLRCEGASIDSKGNIIYRSFDGNSVICWNPQSGKRERIVYADMMMLLSACGLIRNSEGEIIILSYRDNNLRKYSFSGPAQSVTIVVDGLTFIPYEVKEYFRRYEGTHPGIKFEVVSEAEITGTDMDIRANKIFAEMSEGKGPDIIFMYGETFRDYAGTGALLDISDIFSEKKKSEILPQIQEMGLIDGKRYAVYTDFDMGLIVTNKDTWDKNSWTVGDVLKLIDDRKKAGNPFEYLEVSSYGAVIYPLQLFMRDIDNSDWINYETGTCDFDNDEFKKVLQICKEYYPTWGTNVDAYDIQQGIKDGKILCMSDGGSFVTYSSIMAECNGEDIAVGYPTNTGKGTMIAGGSAMVINKNTEHYDIIKDFVECMYSFDYMGHTSWAVPYSPDMFKGRIVTPNMPGMDYMDSPAIKLDNHTYMPIKGKADGETYFPEYEEIITNSRAYIWRQNEITSIIFEEADRYFESDSISLQEIVNCIQSRVSLYLAENF